VSRYRRRSRDRRSGPRCMPHRAGHVRRWCRTRCLRRRSGARVGGGGRVRSRRRGCWRRLFRGRSRGGTRRALCGIGGGRLDLLGEDRG
jgi:hypothetical protein